MKVIVYDSDDDLMRNLDYEEENKVEEDKNDEDNAQREMNKYRYKLQYELQDPKY